MTGLTIEASKKIRALKSVNEGELLLIIDDVIQQAEKPAQARAEEFRQLVNRMQEETTKARQEMSDLLAEKQNEIIRLREELGDARSKITSAAQQIGTLQAENERLVDDLATLRAQFEAPATPEPQAQE